MNEGHAGLLWRMLDAPVPGKRRNGRQNTRWKDLCKMDMANVGLKEVAVDWKKWKNDIQYYSGDLKLWVKLDEEKRKAKEQAYLTHIHSILEYSCTFWDRYRYRTDHTNSGSHDWKWSNCLNPVLSAIATGGHPCGCAGFGTIAK